MGFVYKQYLAKFVIYVRIVNNAGIEFNRNSFEV